MHALVHHTTKTRTKVIIGTLIGLALILALAILIAPKATAAGGTLGVCSASIPLNLSPGVQLLTPTSGTNQSFGETGTLNCAGTFEGKPIAGPGTVGFKATYSGTCLSVAGGGSWSFTIPVTINGGIQLVHRSGTYNGPAIGTVIVFDGTYPGGKLTGTGLVVPTQGDCALTPMTKATFNFLGLQLSS